MLSRILSTVGPFFTREWVQILLYGLVFCSSALFLAFNGGVTNDSWWHLKTGEELWQGTFSFNDPHNWTAPGVFWPAHELGFEWILYGLWKLAGDSFLLAAVVNVLLVLGTMALLIPSKSLREKFQLRSNILVPLLIFGAVYIMLGSVQIRAQALSYFLFALTVRLILAKKPYVLPPLFLLWVWLHGSVLIGVALFGVATLLMIGRWLLERANRDKLKDAIQFSIAGILSLVVLNFSPLGLKIWPYFLETFSYGKTRISEWQPLFSSPEVIGYSVALIALLSLAAWVLWRKKGSWEIIYLYAMSLFFLIYSLGALRVFSNFLMVALPILFIAAMSLFTGEKARPTRAPAPEKILKIVAFFMVGVLTVVSLLFMIPITQKVMETSGRDPFIKDGVAEVLRSDQCKDSTWNDYDTGSYLIWYMPDIKVSIDSRFDLYPRWVTDAAGVTIPPGGDTDPTELLNKVFRDYGISCMVMSNTTDSLALEARGLKVIGENIDTIVFEVPESGIPARP